jgi:PST family polysaccharide transporter
MSDATPSRSEGGQAARGVLVTGFAQAFKIGLGFLSGIVLARLLTPRDFGLVAMVGPAVALVALVQDLGLGQATIQRERITRRQIQALFWVAFGVSVVLAGALAASSGLIAQFYGEPAVAPLAVAFAGLVLVWSLNTQPVAILSRDMRFTALAVTDVVAATVGFAVGAGVAYFYRTYWALFFGTLAAGVTTVVLTFTFSRFSPGLPRLAPDLRAMLGFGGAVSGFNVVNFLARNADQVLIARFHGAAALGLYERAYKLLLFPLQQVTHPLSRVMMPLLSRRQSDPVGYRRAYLDCITLLMLVTHPAIVTATVFAHDVFLLLLGERWVDAAPIFVWLGIAGMHQVMTSTMGWLFLSQGRGRDYFVVGAVSCVLTLCAFVIGLPWGPVGVAMALTLSELSLKAPLAWIVAGRQGPVSLKDLVRAALPHAAALGTTAGVALALSAKVEAAGLVTLGAATIVAYLVYGATLALAPAKRKLGFEWAARLRAILSRRTVVPGQAA